MVKQVLPVFRAMVAESLVERHGLTQTEAAERMGITQAAISQYVGEKRGYPKTGTEALSTIIRPTVEDYARKLAVPNGTEGPVVLDFCKVCPTILNELMKDQTGTRILNL
jgi:predicted transcriptional regulator